MSKAETISNSPPEEKETKNPEQTQDSSQIEAVGLADALASVGCSIRDKFIATFSTAWHALYDHPISESTESKCKEENSKDTKRVDSPPPENDMNFTGSKRGIAAILSHINVRQTVQSFLDYIAPDFSPDDPFSNADSDSDDFFGAHRGGVKFIDRYSVEDITNFIKNSKFGAKLIESGFPEWYIDFDLSDCFSHYCYLRSPKYPEKDQFIGFIIIQIGEFKLRLDDNSSKGYAVLKSFLPSSLNLLNIRWLSLQNPGGTFSARKPRLPGQRYPGTGFARDACSLLVELAQKANRDGIVNSPEHFHNAFLYEGFQFLNPEDEGRFVAMKRDLAKDISERGLAAVSWAVYLGFLREKGVKTRWESRNQVLPLSHRLASFFRSSEFRRAAEEASSNAGPFTIDWKEAERFCLSAILDFSAAERTIPGTN